MINIKPKVYTAKSSDSDQGQQKPNYLNRIKWTVQCYDHTYRCKDCLEVEHENIKDSNKPIELQNSTVDFNLDDYLSLNDFDYKKFEINNNTSNFFLLEHIGGDDKDSGIFENKKYIKQIINNMYESITKEEGNSEGHISGKAINKIPRILWIVHRKIPAILNPNSKLYKEIDAEDEAINGGDEKILFKLN